MSESKGCLTKGCECITPGRRGLCKQCYDAACIYVATGQSTWKKLEKAGKVAPPKPSRVEARVAWFNS